MGNVNLELPYIMKVVSRIPISTNVNAERRKLECIKINCTLQLIQRRNVIPNVHCISMAITSDYLLSIFASTFLILV